MSVYAESPHGGNIYDFPSRELLDFSSNINPAGPPGYAITAAAEALGRVGVYPDSRQGAVRGAFSRWLGVLPDELAFGNGASDLIRAAIAAFKPSRLIVALPTFSEYAESARVQNIPVVGVTSDVENNFAPDVSGILKIFSRGDMLVICQPNNPTGTPWSGDDLRCLSRVCSDTGGFLLADECFINLAHPALPSCLGMTDSGRVVVLRALTKDFAAPGLRVGFIVAREDTAKAVRGHLTPWPLNCVGEAFALACAGRPEPYLGDSAAAVAEQRSVLSGGLSALGYRVNPSSVNFILARSLSRSVTEIHGALLKRSVLIRKCANFPALDDSYFRVAVRGAGDNAALLSGLAGIAAR